MPMDSNVKIDFTEDWREKKFDDLRDPQSAVGSLRHPAGAMQPGISFAVSTLSR